MRVAGRVNALDWDNVGTITHLHDTTGTATVQFTTSNRKHTRTRTMAWSDLKPIDHPEPSDIGDRAQRCLDDPDLPASGGEQHIDRLHERLNDLDKQIEQTETDVTLWDWGQRTDQTLAAAHNRRSNHLAYTALTNMEPWIENLLRADASGRTTNAMDVRRLIQDVATYRELTHHTGSDPLGPGPTGTSRLKAHRRLRDQSDTAAAVDGVEPTLE